MVNINNIRIITDRLILKNVLVSDVTQDYVDWLNDQEINKYLSCANSFQTIESCMDYAGSFELRNDSALIGIFLKENDLHIGNIAFSPPIDWLNKVGTVGVSIGRKNFWGKGMAKEALSAIIKYSFNNLELHRLQAVVAETNLNSLMLFLSCGFKIEGRLRESAIIRDQVEDGYILSVLENDH